MHFTDTIFCSSHVSQKLLVSCKKLQIFQEAGQFSQVYHWGVDAKVYKSDKIGGCSTIFMFPTKVYTKIEG